MHKYKETCTLKYNFIINLSSHSTSIDYDCIYSKFKEENTKGATKQSKGTCD